MAAASMIIAPQDSDAPGLAADDDQAAARNDQTGHAAIYRGYESELVE
ncbi:MAG: hypothetical protein ACLPKI_31815 [Streptosporangiaceae bacterium]